MYCSCLTTTSSSFSMFLLVLTISLFIPSITSSSSSHSRSYFPDLLVIKSIYWRILTGFCVKFGYHLLFHTCVEPFPSLLPTFPTTIETCYTQFIEFPIKLSKLNSLDLFQSSRSLDLHFKSRFFLSNWKFFNNFPPKTVIYIKKDTSKIV